MNKRVMNKKLLRYLNELNVLTTGYIECEKTFLLNNRIKYKRLKSNKVIFRLVERDYKKIIVRKGETK